MSINAILADARYVDCLNAKVINGSLLENLLPRMIATLVKYISDKRAVPQLYAKRDCQLWCEL